SSTVRPLSMALFMWPAIWSLRHSATNAATVTRLRSRLDSPGALPDVTEEHVIGELDKLRSEVSDQLLSTAGFRDHVRSPSGTAVVIGSRSSQLLGQLRRHADRAGLDAGIEALKAGER